MTTVTAQDRITDDGIEARKSEEGTGRARPLTEITSRATKERVVDKGLLSMSDERQPSRQCPDITDRSGDNGGLLQPPLPSKRVLGQIEA